MRSALRALPLVILLGCSSAASDGETTDDSPAAPFGGTSAGNAPSSGKGSPAPAPAPPPDANLIEVVQVLIDGDRGFCTGTLVSRMMVVTAAHCLDESSFGSWDVLASLAPGTPKVHAAQVRRFDDDYEDVAKPDIGVVILSEPIELPAYAELTDVTARVEGDAKVTGAAMVRKFVDVESPFIVVGGLQISSDAENGYDFGLVSKFFSKGGDSGAGLFLVDDGRRTHRLIGVARQPEPDKNLDHFTRVDAAFITWVKGLGD